MMHHIALLGYITPSLLIMRSTLHIKVDKVCVIRMLSNVNHKISVRWLANPNSACSHLSPNFWVSYDYLIHYQCEDSCPHFEWSCSSTQSCWLINESKMVSIFWARSPTSFNYMFYWCLSLGPYQTTYHLSIGVQFIIMLELGTSTLLKTIHLKQKWLCPLRRAFGLLWFFCPWVCPRMMYCVWMFYKSHWESRYKPSSPCEVPSG
jgi:hypothetical protein